MTITAPKPEISRALCSVCGGAMTIHEEVRGGACAKLPCRTTAALRRIALQKAAAEAALNLRIKNIQSTIFPLLRLEKPDSAAVVIVPASERRCVPLPRKRKSGFRQHLSALLAEALKQTKAEPAPASSDEREPAASPFAAEAPALRAACATCRGHCCHIGAARNAFLEVETLRRGRALRPNLQPREIIGEYMSHVPRESVQDSCVFHGAHGCTLPRQMRADICNNFHCDGLQRLTRLDEAPRAPRILIVASSETAAVRWRMFDRNDDTPE